MRRGCPAQEADLHRYEPIEHSRLFLDYQPWRMQAFAILMHVGTLCNLDGRRLQRKDLSFAPPRVAAQINQDVDTWRQKTMPRKKKQKNKKLFACSTKTRKNEAHVQTPRPSV